MGGVVGGLAKMATGGGGGLGSALLGGTRTGQLLSSMTPGSGATPNPFAGLINPANTSGSVTPTTANVPLPGAGFDAVAPDKATPGVHAPTVERYAPSNIGYEPVIRKYAEKYGVDPNIAIRVAKAEGGTSGYIQSRVKKNGVREPSYGPFQLLVGGAGTGFPEGMGNQMMRETGLDPRDPANAEAAIDFAMKQASKHGWGQWYGAKAIGLSNYAGIRAGAGGTASAGAGVQAGATTTPTTVDYPTSVHSRLFGGTMTPGPLEQMQRLGQEDASRGPGPGAAPQVQAEDMSQTGPAADTGEQDVASAAAQINQKRMQETPNRQQQRKEELRRRVRGEVQA